MNSILIIAHSPLASAFKSAALHALPQADAQIEVIDVLPNQTPEEILCASQQLLRKAQQEQGFLGSLVLSDVVGATPCNVARQLVNGAQVKCVAGASLPMLLRAIVYAQLPLEQMAQKATAGATLGAVELV